MVSVIFPVYNVGKYLERAVRSAAEQTYKNTEIILVDDGSPDNSGEICDRLSRQYDNVTVIHKENGGAASARNAGLEAAHGKYIMFLDSDDYIDRDTAETMVEAMEKEEADVVTVNFRAEKNGTVTEHMMKMTPGTVEYPAADFLEIYRRWGKEISVFNWNCLYRRSVIDKLQLRFLPMTEVWSEDQLFNLCYYTAVRKGVYIDRSLYNYAVHEGTLSRSRKKPEIIPRKVNLSLQLKKFADSRGVKISRDFCTLRMWDDLIEACRAMDSPEDAAAGIGMISGKVKRHYKRCLFGMLFGRAGRYYVKDYGLSRKSAMFLRLMILLLILDRPEKPVRSYLYG